MGCAASQAVGVVEIGQTKGNERLFHYNESGKVKHINSSQSLAFNLKGVDKANMFGAAADNTSIFSNDSGYTDDYHKRISSGEKSGKSSASRHAERLSAAADKRRQLELPPLGVGNGNGNSSLKGLPPLNFNTSKKAKSNDPANDLLTLTGLVQKRDKNYAKFELVEERLMSRNLSMLTLKSNMDVMPAHQHQQQPQSQQPKGPPLRLLLQREKTKPTLTAGDIEEKLERANQRKMEQLKLRGSISIADKRPDNTYDFIKRDLKKQQPGSDDEEEFNKDVIERQKRLREMRDKIKAKNVSESAAKQQQQLKRGSPPVSAKEMEKELEKFRPKTPANFKPVYN